MAGRFLALVWLVGFATAAPTTWDDSKCSTECSESTKFLFADKTTYVYNYEVSNTLHMEGNPDMLSAIKATVEITQSSKCEMSLQITQLSVQHDSKVETSSPYIDDLKRNTLHFSWDDGRIKNICPNPEDKADIINIKRGILSALQNSMKSTWHDLFLRETDVLGTCDTEYIVEAFPPDNPKTIVKKTKNLASCSPHLQGKTAFLAASYDSHASPQQDLPFFSNREYSCEQVLDKGFVEETTCKETGEFTPLSDYGYTVKVKGELKLLLVSSRAAEISPYKIQKRNGLVFEYDPKIRHVVDTEVEAALRELCPKVNVLLQEGVGELVHKVVNLIRGLAPQSVEKIYNSLKTNEICESTKLQGIYLDALKMASTEGAVQLLTKLTINHEISETEIMLWLLTMPFIGRPDEGAIRAAMPLLGKGVGSSQAFLSVSAMAHKFCLHHSDCESVPIIKELISNLEQFLGNKCHSSSTSENEEIITALKSFGNLGVVGGSRDKILDCAMNTENIWPVRIAAVEAFRRTPCSETGRERLTELYATTTDEVEERIAAFMTLIKCPSSEFIGKVNDVYNKEISNQVKSFVWSYFENLKTSSDPSKRVQKHLADHLHLMKPNSTDITKFSQNFQRSLFSETLNIGGSLESNLIFTRHSFIPRSLNMDFSVDFFGYKLNLLELGVRTEDVEYLLEKAFGPRGTVSNYKLNDFISYISGRETDSSGDGSSGRQKRSTNPYQQKLDVLDERYHFAPWKPRGSMYLRIMGNELRWRRFDISSEGGVGDIDINGALKRLADYKKIDVAHTFMFFDTNILIPSVTGYAYELAANGSTTVGLKAQGRFNMEQPNFPRLNADIDGKIQPSAVVELSATMTLHSEDYEPGFKIRTSMNLGQNTEVMVKMVNGRKIHTKFNFPSEKNNVFSLKRNFYVIDQDGERKIEKGNIQNYEYCTKNLDKILGVQYCAKMKFPHVMDSNNKPVVTVMGSMTTELSIRKTDTSMTGYELIAQLPEEQDTERIFKLSVDTPGSSEDRRYSTEVKVTHPNSETCNAELKFHTPFYALDGTSTFTLRPEILQLRVEATGNKARKYEFNLDVEKNIRGARLSEYKPSLRISLPNRQPFSIQGTIVSAKGNKEQLTIDLSSESFGSPLKIKGSFAKEDEIDGSQTNCRFASDVTVNFGPNIYKLLGTTEKIAGEYSSDVRFDYNLPDKEEQVHWKAKLKDLHLLNPTQFSAETEVQISEFPDYNTQLKWDFSIKLLEHLKSDITFRYGRDFTDNSRIVHLKHANKILGDFATYKKMDLENELVILAPCIHIDRSMVFTASWDFIENPKFLLDVGVKSGEAGELKLGINYSHLSRQPVQITTEIKVIYFGDEYIYRDQLQETSPNEIQGKIVIESRGNTLVTIDYTYKMKSDARKFHHEIDGSIVIPGRIMPIRQKAYLKYSKSNFQLQSHTDTGDQSPYIIEVKLNKVGASEVTLQLPYLDGKLHFNSQPNLQTIQANFQTKGKDERKIVATGTLKRDVTSTLNLEIAFDADKDPKKLIIIKGTSTEADSGDKHLITANINYIGAVNADISGSIGNFILTGPHYMRADFTGNMEPTSLVLSYEIKDWNLESFIQYLRSDVEKVRADIKGKLIQRGYNLDLEGGLAVVSPFKTFDGKEIFYKLHLDTSGPTRSFETEYRLKYATDTGHVGKAGYSRKRGWPGKIKANILFTKDGKPIYETRTELEYGNRRYSFTTNMIPAPKKKFNLDTSFEYAASYANFHHSILSSLNHYQSISLNAVADLRQSEDLKLLSNLDVNDNKMYDVNATFSDRGFTDFEGHVLLFSKITPSIRIRTKTNNANSVTKYTFNIQKSDEDVVIGNGELRKRKKGFSADATLKYKGKDIMSLTVNNDVKSQRERTYTIKTVVGSRTYTANIHNVKEKKANKNTINLCSTNTNKCIDINTVHKETDTKNEWSVTYKRDDLELNLERTVVRTADNSRYHALVRSGDRVYGYDIKLGQEGSTKRFGLGLIGTYREMNMDLEYDLNPEDLKLNLELQTDAKRFPDRKFVLHTASKNKFGRESSTVTDISLSHPSLEKEIEIKFISNVDSSNASPFTAEISADYSTNPDHKLITKIRWEKLDGEGRGGNLHVDVYHKDDQHLIVAFESKGKLTADDLALQMGWKWPAPNNGDKEVNMKADWNFKEHKLIAEYHRPEVHRTLTAVAVYPPERKTIEVDVEYNFNGEISQSKIKYYREGECVNVDYTAIGTGFTHNTEICMSQWSRTLFSIQMVTNDEDTGTLHNSMEIIHQGYGALKVRNQWNSDSVGLATYQLLAIIDEITEALESPPETAAKLKSMRSYVEEKILIPFQEFLSSGVVKLREDTKNELDFFKRKATEYYEYLPPMQNFLAVLKPIREIITEYFLESLAMVKEQFPEFTVYYENFMKDVKQIVALLDDYCSGNSFCPALIEAIVEGSYSKFLTAVEQFILTLPEQIEKIASYSDRQIRAFFNSQASRISRFLESIVMWLNPLLDNRYVHEVRRLIDSVHSFLQDRYGNEIESVLSIIRRTCQDIRNSVFDNEHIRKMLTYIRDETEKLKKELQAVDARSIYKMLQKQIEDFLTNSRLPTSEMFFKVNTFNPERGVLDVDFYSPVDISFYKRIITSLTNLRHLRPQEIQYALTSRYMVAQLKRAAALNLLPPYPEQAIIVSNQHFVTFDKTFYDFAGECSYLLARDFDNGNFSLLAKYPEKSGGHEMSVIMIVGEVIIEVKTGDHSVTVGDKSIDLPFSSPEIRAVREGNTIIVEDKHGLILRCHTVYEICWADISGWYFGKTAGLLGTYNYESYEDMKRPRGHIAQNVANFAKSWEVGKGCKSKNLAHTTAAVEGSESYRICEYHFGTASSPLFDCFTEVNPAEYFGMCLRHLHAAEDKKKAFCSVALSYVLECEKHYFEINLPPKCLECDAPDGTLMNHGDRKKFSELQQKAADVVFVVENHSCNQKLVRDLNNLARAIDRELVNEGFADNHYGIVSFGGPDDEPLSHTVRGKILFSAQDTILSMENFASDSTLSESSSALEALRHAVMYPFHGGSAKTFVLLSCSPCNYNFKSLAYPVIQQLLLEHAINLHVVNNQEIQIRKLSAKGKDIVGVDVETVYSVRDVTQKDLIGEPSIRPQVSLPKDMCVALSQDVDGSFFSYKSLDDGTQTDLKNWRSILSRRILKRLKVSECQYCDCTSTKDHVPKTVCQPCTIQRPRLPFTVCKDCNVPGYVASVVSLFLRLIS